MKFWRQHRNITDLNALNLTFSKEFSIQSRLSFDSLLHICIETYIELSSLWSPLPPLPLCTHARALRHITESNCYLTLQINFVRVGVGWKDYSWQCSTWMTKRFWLDFPLFTFSKKTSAMSVTCFQCLQFLYQMAVVFFLMENIDIRHSE